MDDAAAYAVASEFERGYYARAAGAGATTHPLGLRLSDPAVPRAHVQNMLWVTAATASAEDVLAALEATQSHLGHRKAEIADDALGAALAPSVRTAGYDARRFVWMALRRPRDHEPAPGLARETDAATHAIVEAATTAEFPHGEQRDVVRQLAAARAALRAAATTRFVVGAVDGADAAHATLVAGSSVAQLEDVTTLTAFHDRGLARAVCSLAVDLAPAGALTFVVAEADDWPHQLYAKLGFDPVGASWAFVRDPA